MIADHVADSSQAAAPGALTHSGENIEVRAGSTQSKLVEAGILAESGERLAFRHDLIRDAEQASIPARHARWTATGAKVLPACRALSVEIAMQLAESAESRDGKTNREIAKYLFVSPHRKRPRSPQFREFESQVLGQLASVAAGGRLDIARTCDAWAARLLSPWPGEMPFLRWCRAVRTVARS